MDDSGAPDSIDQWAEASRQLREQAFPSAVTNSLAQAQAFNPDQDARHQAAARTLGIPTDAAREFPDEVRRQVAARLIDPETLIKTAPATSKFLTRQDNANIAHDDVQNLSSAEQGVQQMTAWNPSMGERFSGWLQKTFTPALNTLYGNAPEPQKQFVANLLNQGSFGLVPNIAGEAQTTAGGIAKGAGGLLGFLGGAPLKVAEAGMAKFGPGILEHVTGEGFAKALSRDVASQGLTLGAASGLAELGNVIDSPDLATAAGKEASAVGSGALTGAIFGSVSRLLPKDTVSQFIARSVANTVGTDIAAGKMPFEDVANWDTLTPEQKGMTVFNYGLNAFFSVHGAAHADLIRSHFEQAAKIEQAQTAARGMDVLSEASKLSALRQRGEIGADTFKQLVTDMTDAHGASDLWIKADDFADVMNKSGIGMDELQRILPDVASQMKAASETQGDIKIPIADYATHIAPTEFHQALRDNLKFAEDGPTVGAAEKDIQQQHEENSKALAEQSDKILAERAKNQPFIDSAKQIQDRMAKEISDTGRYTPDMAKAIAATIKAHYVVLAQHENLLPHEAMEKHPLGIQGEGAGGYSQGEKGYYQPENFKLQQGEGNRGSFDPVQRIVSLLKDADLSTIHHELGHAFLENMARVAETSPAMAADLDKAFKWMGYDGTLAEWNKLTLDEKRPFHEKFAQGYEAYLFEGKSPNLEMQGLFSRFKAWMVETYKELKNLGVPLTPEMRGVYDRLLASEDQIKEAEAVREYRPLFETAEEAARYGMTPEEYATYKADANKGTQDAIETMQARSLRDMKWLGNATSKILKAMQREAKETRDKVMGEVQDQVLNSPEHKAAEFMQDNPDVPKDLVAEQHGFKSAGDMNEAIAKMGNTRELINALTDQRMLQEHGELSSPEAIQRAAEEAIHNQARGKFMATGLKILTRAQATGLQILKAAKEAAMGRIAELKVKDVNPKQYSAAEARANKEALKLVATAPAKAAEAQRAALLNNQLAAEALKAADEVRRFLAYVKRFDRTSIRSKVDVDIREQIDQLLERFDFRKNPTDKPTAQQVQLQTWIESQIARGYSPVVHPDMVNPAVRMHYSEMTMEQMRGLRDTVAALEQIGRERKTITIDGKKMDVKDAVAPMVEKMQLRGERYTDQQIADKPRRGVDNIFRVALDRIKASLFEFGAFAKAQHFKANQYDLHEVLGPFHRFFFEPVFAANYRYLDMQERLSKEIRATAESLGKDWQESLTQVVDNHALADNSLDVPVKRRLTRGDLLGIAVHVGNESNFDKLTKGMKWAPESVWKTLEDNMTGQDWEAVKAVWNAANAHWPEMEAMNRRLGNDSPDKIEARAFQLRTKDGTLLDLPGGYAPIRYDRMRSKLAIRKSDASAVNPADGLFGRDYFRADTTTNGSLNSRMTNYHDFVDLDVNRIQEAIQDTIRDLAYREALIDAHKLLVNPEFRKQMLRTYGEGHYEQLQQWLGNIVNGRAQNETQNIFTQFMSKTRHAVVANGIAFRVSTMAKHGSSAALKTLGYTSGGGQKYFAARGAKMSYDWNGQVAEAIAKSPEIRARARQQDRDFAQTISSLTHPESIHGKAERFGHMGVAMLDFATAVPTFNAAYDWATTTGIPVKLGGTGQPMTHSDAVKYADSVVREAHGTNIETGRSNMINSRSELMKTLTTLHGFMNNAFGQNADALDKAMHAKFFGKPELAARLLMANMASALIAGMVTYGIKKDDQTWAEWAAELMAAENAGTLPMVRDIWAATVEGRDSAGVPPWMRVFTDTHKLAKDVAAGEGAKHLIRDAGNVAGLFLPGLGQGGATAQFLWDEARGNQDASTVGEWVRGLVKGQSQEPAHH